MGDKNADEESLQAKWFYLEKLNDNAFKSELRCSDFLNITQLAIKYYEKYGINSLSILNENDLLKLNSNQYLKLPIKILQKHITFNYLIVNSSLKKCIVHENMIPSIAFIPDCYFNNLYNFLIFSLKSIVFVDCFKYSNLINITDKKILDICHDGSQFNNTVNDGIAFLFFVCIDQVPDHKSSLNEDYDQTINNYKWLMLQDNSEIKKRLENELNFIKLLGN